MHAACLPLMAAPSWCVSPAPHLGFAIARVAEPALLEHKPPAAEAFRYVNQLWLQGVCAVGSCCLLLGCVEHVQQWRVASVMLEACARWALEQPSVHGMLDVPSSA